MRAVAVTLTVVFGAARRSRRRGRADEGRSIRVTGRRRAQQCLGRESGIDPLGDIGGHARGSRQGTEHPPDLLQRCVDVRAQLARFQVLPYVGGPGRLEQSFGEVGDLGDVRVPGHVRR